jgi:hypothetical protein
MARKRRPRPDPHFDLNTPVPRNEFWLRGLEFREAYRKWSARPFSTDHATFWSALRWNLH